MSILQEKSALRREAEKIKSAFTESYIKESDEAIYRAFTALPEYLAAQTLFCYFSMPDEISTAEIYRDALSRGKKIALPVSYKGGRMVFRIVTRYEELRPGVLGIMEPRDSCVLTEPKLTDVAAVPAVAYGEDKLRLGRGGGYYDNWLSKNKLITIGLCREKLLFSTVPSEPHDIPVDMVLTEKRLIK